MAGDSSLSLGSEVDDVVAAGPVAATSVDMMSYQAAAQDAAEPGFEQFGSRAAFETWLIEQADAVYGSMFGKPTYSWNYWNYWNLAVDRDLGTTVLMASDTGDHSTTNLQVAGVDEADLVETDGSYLYVISGNELVIVSAGVADDLRVVSRVRFEGRAVGLYLFDKRVAIVSQSQRSVVDGVNGGAGGMTSYPLYGGSRATTRVTVFSIGDAEEPRHVETTELDGRLVTSRSVDGELRMVLDDSLWLPPLEVRAASASEAEAIEKRSPSSEPTIQLLVDVAMLPGRYGTQYVYESREDYIARLRETYLGSVLPQVRQLGTDGELISSDALVDVAELYKPESGYSHTMTTVATLEFGTGRNNGVHTASVMTTYGTQVYVTADSVYLFSRKAHDTYTPRNEVVTNVWRFTTPGDGNGVSLAAKGSFEGVLLNQFAVDERDGFLRLVTGSANWTEGHGVRVLQEVGGRLEVVSSLDGIAPTEQMYSVRFMDDRVFFVTFRQTDPLFAVDLSDPMSPELLGELHIPGYSDYLQPIDENHLIAIGRGADEATGMFQELQVSIFDISDLLSPKLLHRYSFSGGRTTASIATGNPWTRGDGDHHAVSYFAEEQIFAIPIHSEGWWGDVNPLFAAGEGGLQVFQIDIENGFTPLGIVEHDTRINRSVRIEDRLYAVSNGSVTAHELNDPNTQLGEVSIAPVDVETELDPAPRPWMPITVWPGFVIGQPLILTAVESPPIPEFETGTLLNVDVDAAPPIGWASPSLDESFRNAQPTFLSRRVSETSSAAPVALKPWLFDLLNTRSEERQSSRQAEVENWHAEAVAADDWGSVDEAMAALETIAPSIGSYF